MSNPVHSVVVFMDEDNSIKTLRDDATHSRWPVTVDFCNERDIPQVHLHLTTEQAQKLRDQLDRVLQTAEEALQQINREDR